jgi:hypothetical protein
VYRCYWLTDTSLNSALLLATLNRSQFVRHIEHLLILEIPING